MFIRCASRVVMSMILAAAFGVAGCAQEKPAGGGAAKVDHHLRPQHSHPRALQEDPRTISMK
jgi:hypothetical protein